MTDFLSPWPNKSLLTVATFTGKAQGKEGKAQESSKEIFFSHSKDLALYARIHYANYASKGDVGDVP